MSKDKRLICNKCFGKEEFCEDGIWYECECVDEYTYKGE